MATIHRGMWIEELVDILPDAVSVLIGKGMKPLACGEPVWETIEGIAGSRGYTDAEIDALVDELESLYKKKGVTGSGRG